MVWSPALASRILILKKRSDFFVGPFFSCLKRIYLSQYVTINNIVVVL